MSFFKKKNENDPPREKNEITNTQLKESIANSALSILSQGDDYEKLENIKVEFGYLFDIEFHGIEALLKIITDKTTAYFAVQGKNLMRLNFSEELFQTTVEGFMNLHG